MWEKELQVAIAAAREGGKLLKEAFESHSLQVSFKDDLGADLVTETDKQVQQIVAGIISNAFPEDLFLGEEEATQLTAAQINKGRCWIVDPIDGTTNFVHSIPFCCVSIAFASNGVPVVGVVFNPMLGQLFSASQGNGAFLNETQRLKVSTEPFTSLERAMVATEYGSDRSGVVLDSKLKSIDNIVRCGVRGIRSLGSSALCTCYVAFGIFDVFYEAGIHAWDISAASVVLAETGGRVVNWDNSGEPLDLFCRKFVAIRGAADINASIKMVQSYLEPIHTERDLE